MKRRQFLKNSIIASSLVLAGCATNKASSGSTAQPKGKQEYYELRTYRLKSAADEGMIHEYLQNAAIPAWNRLGIKPVGVFVEREPKEPAIYVLIPYATLDVFGKAATRLTADPQYMSAASKYLQRGKEQPGFDRVDSWLMLAFAGIPKLEQPSYSQDKTERMFEFRTYESYSEAKALKKIDMFNNGEIQLMRDVGLGPIFFGQALIGRDLPHLTYMLSAPNKAAHDEHWKKFGGHPTWKQMSSDPQYADTVSKIRNWFVVPTPYSQI